jgi:phosphate transport system permease protein
MSGSSQRARKRSLRLTDGMFGAIGLGATLIGIVVLVVLFYDLASRGIPHLSWDFFTNFPSRHAEKSGILSAWVGTCLVMFVTALAAIPFGIAAGIYLEEYAPKNRLTSLIELNVTNLAAVPSIVYGLLALGLFVYTFGLGRSVLTAGLTLGLLVMPVIIVATREAIRTIPQGIREAAYALGSTKWEVTRNHVIPYAMGGIITGVIIGMARAIGETAPIVTIGALSFIAFLPTPLLSTQMPFVSLAWLSDPFTVMPIQIFNWVSRPGAEFAGNAAAAGLVLMVITLVMNGIALYFRYRIRKRLQW